jgi:hypothetical protein
VPHAIRSFDGHRRHRARREGSDVCDHESQRKGERDSRPRTASESAREDDADQCRDW